MMDDTTKVAGSGQVMSSIPHRRAADRPSGVGGGGVNMVTLSNLLVWGVIVIHACCCFEAAAFSPKPIHNNHRRIGLLGPVRKSMPYVQSLATPDSEVTAINTDTKAESNNTNGLDTDDSNNKGIHSIILPPVELIQGNAFSLLAGLSTITLLKSEERKDAIGKGGGTGSSATNWIDEESAYMLQKALDRSALKVRLTIFCIISTDTFILTICILKVCCFPYY
jgi:hypothetical protein